MNREVRIALQITGILPITKTDRRISLDIDGSGPEERVVYNGEENDRTNNGLVHIDT